jgi:hypothetical protein
LLPLFEGEPAIERVESLDPASFRSTYVANARPVIFGSGFSGWRASATWTPEALAARVPDAPVVDEHTGACGRLKDFVRDIGDGAGRWGRLHRIDRIPELAPDVEPIPVCIDDSWIHGRHIPAFYGLKQRIQRHARPELLVGGAGSYFPTYHHEHSFCHCLLFQIFGRKRVVLFEPASGPSLYPQAEHKNKSVLSPVEAADPIKYPGFRHARFFTGILQPGDTLFSPSGWWLGLQNPDVSLTVRRHYVEGSNWALFRREFIADRRRYSNAFKAAVDAAALSAAALVYARRRPAGS